MAESPATMRSVEYIQDLLDLLVQKEIDQTETLAEIQNEILTAVKGLETAIKSVENAVERLHSTLLTIHEESTGNVPVNDGDQSPEPSLYIPTQGR